MPRPDPIPRFSFSHRNETAGPINPNGSLASSEIAIRRWAAANVVNGGKSPMHFYSYADISLHRQPPVRRRRIRLRKSEFAPRRHDPRVEQFEIGCRLRIEPRVDD